MGTLLSPAAFSHRYLCGLLAALMVCGPALPLGAQQRQPSGPTEAIDEAGVSPQNDKTLLAQPPAPAEINLAYALPNPCVILVARPEQIFAAPALEMMPLEVMQAAAQVNLNVDPLKLQQLVVTVEPPVEGPPSYAIYGQFSQATELKSTELDQATDEAEVAGNTYRRARDPMAPSVYQPNDRAILLAPDAVVRQFATAEPPANVGPLVAEVAAAAKTDDLFALVDVAALRPLINMGLSQAPIPPELQSLTQLPNLFKTIELRVNLSNPGVTELVATANSPQDAARVEEIIDGLKQQVREKVAAENKRLIASGDPVEAAQARYQQRMAKHWDEMLQLQIDGARMTLFHIDPAEAGAQSELMMVAVAGILVALLLPAVQAAREAARRTQSMNNLKQIVLALHNYHDSKGSFPAQANFDGEGEPLLSWRVHILPYLEQQELYEQFHLDEPWDSEHNAKLIEKMPEVYLDPSSALDPSQGHTHYLGVAGDDYVFATEGRGRALRQITDGASNTIAVVQGGDANAVPWTKPDDYSPGEGDPVAELRNSLHPGIFLAALADGSVHAIANAVDADEFRAMLTIGGGEVVNAP